MTLFTLVLATPLRAQTLGQGDICDPTTKQLDRERLAMLALAKAGVSPYPYRWAQTHEPAEGQVKAATPAQQILANEGFCNGDGTDAGLPRCGKDDSQRIGDALTSVIEVLIDHERYDMPMHLRAPGTFFAVGGPPAMCVAAPNGSLGKPTPTTIAAPVEAKDIPLRLRGSTDGLQFDRIRDSAFQGVEKAALTFKSDRAGAKTTVKGTVVAALVVPIKKNVLEFGPYIGIQIDTSKKDDAEKEVTDDIVRAGALVDFRTHGKSVSHLFLFRPEFASNRKEKSEIITAAFSYLPVRNGWLNDAMNVVTADNRSLFSIIPRLELRLTGGEFTKLGTRTLEESQDFIRIGGQVGVTFTSDIKWLPLELTITETYMHALEGSPDSLSLFKGIFSLYFDEKKYFGIDLGYTRGRRDDLSKREHNWTIGLGAKF